MEEGRTLLHVGDEEQEVHSESHPRRRGAALFGGALLAAALLVAVLVSGYGFPARAPDDAALDSLTVLTEVVEDANDLDKEVYEGIPIYTDQGARRLKRRRSAKRAAKRASAPVQDYVINLGTDASKYAKSLGKAVVFTGKKIPHVVVRGTLEEVKAMLHAHPEGVQFVEQDVKMSAIPEVSPKRRRLAPASWGLDRVDERDLPLSRSPYDPSGKQGEGVHVYVFDTGIRTSHSDFGGRAIPTLESLGRVKECRSSDRSCAMDNQGHGTHCAGTIGGADHGVATKATLRAVKVLSDSGGGSYTWMDMALDWVIRKGPKPAVVSASLGGPGKVRSTQTAIDTAVEAGVTVVVAAGNENQDACGFTPAYIPSAITVGATEEDDDRSSFSNFGTCVDIFAPGTDIVSAGKRGDNARTSMSGTSMACPHVSGAAALLLSSDKSLSPRAVAEQLGAHATIDTVHDHGIGSPDKLLYIGSAADFATPAPSPGGGSCDKDGWKVTSGDCTIDAQCCLLSPGYPNRYGKNAQCKVTVGTSPGIIKAEAFLTEAGYDKLKVNSVEYSGPDSPHDIAPRGTVTWSADYSVQAKGFKLCLPSLGASCPPNGWKKVARCLPKFTWRGKEVTDCSTEDHHGGWCATKVVGRQLYYADCTPC